MTKHHWGAKLISGKNIWELSWEIALTSAACLASEVRINFVGEESECGGQNVIFVNQYWDHDRTVEQQAKRKVGTVQHSI